MSTTCIITLVTSLSIWPLLALTSDQTTSSPGEAAITSVPEVEYDNVCSRLYLRGVDPRKVGQVQAAGVYHLQAYYYNNFPVYKHEHDSIYFYHHLSSGNLQLGSSLGDDNFGLGATVRNLPEPLARWFRPGKQPFLRIIDKWFAYDYSEGVNKPIVGDSITPYCLDGDDDFIKRCTSRLFFNKTIRHSGDNINVPDRDYLEEIPSMYLRPLYSFHSKNTIMYLFYSERQETWFLGTELFQEDESLLRVQDIAMRAEYITKTWEIQDSSGGWTTLTDTALKCKGVPNQDNNATCSAQNPCRNNGQCYENQLGELVCQCTRGFQGPQCNEQMPRCGPVGTLHSIQNDHIATTFCDLKTHLPPPYWFSVCHARGGNQSSAQWITHGKCRPIPTPPPPTTTTTTTEAITTTVSPTTRMAPLVNTASTKPTVTFRVFPLDPKPTEGPSGDFLYSLDTNYSWFVPMVVCVSLFIQVMVPTLIWLAMTVRVCRAERTLTEGRNSNRDVQQILDTVQNRVDRFFRSHPEHEDEYTESTRHELQALYQQFSADRLQKALLHTLRQRAAVKTPSFCRISSLYYYCSVWLWLAFALVCEVMEVTRQSKVVYTLVVMAHLVILGLYACIIVETYRSKERRYLRKIKAAKTMRDTLQILKNLQPEVLMSAKCWHWETKTYATSKSTSAGYSSTKTRDGQVVSAHLVEPVAFARWLDISDTKNVTCAGIINKIHVYTLVVPGDSQSMAYIDQEYTDFCKSHSDKDQTVELTMVRGVTRVPRMAVALDNQSTKPWWMSEPVFWVFSIFGLTWPYRYLFNRRVHDTHVVLVKQLFSGMPQSPIVQEASSPFDTSHLLPKDGAVDISDGIKLVDVSRELPTSDFDTSSECSQEEEHNV